MLIDSLIEKSYRNDLFRRFFFIILDLQEKVCKEQCREYSVSLENVYTYFNLKWKER